MGREEGIVVGSSRLVFKEALLSTLRAYGTTRGAVTKALELGIVRALVLLKPDRIEEHQSCLRCRYSLRKRCRSHQFF